ncbi:MAG: nuclear transport factor 2 family protein [Candidatus Sulfotelmatobacter sp.]
MRACIILACVACLTCFAISQQPSSSARADENPQAGGDSALKTAFEAKIKAEWEALKNKDKKAYGELLADEYQGVEVDGRGERNKIQAINELTDQNVFNYTLWGLKVIPLGPDATFVIYEVTMQFPPSAQIRYSRVYIGELWVKRGGQWKELHYQETHVK